MNELFKELYLEKYGHKINRTVAENIVRGFAVTDGSDRANGEKWTFEESKEVGDRIGINWNEISKSEWYLVLNDIYSNHCKTFKKNGISESVYFDLALDWFKDVDSSENKTFDYYIHL